jgi:hypothetical protein
MKEWHAKMAWMVPNGVLRASFLRSGNLDDLQFMQLFLAMPRELYLIQGYA